MRWNMSWAIVRDLARDVVLTGTGVTVILMQARSPHPSDIVLAAGLALTVPSAYGHTEALRGRGAGSSSPSGSPQEAGSR